MTGYNDAGDAPRSHSANAPATDAFARRTSLQDAGPDATEHFARNRFFPEPCDHDGNPVFWKQSVAESRRPFGPTAKIRLSEQEEAGRTGYDCGYRICRTGRRIGH